VPADWTTVLWLAIAAAALWALQRQMHRHIQGLVLLFLLTGDGNAAALAHFLLLLPGIVVHELSHWLAAKLLGVRVGAVSVKPERKRGRELRARCRLATPTPCARASSVWRPS